VNWGSDAAVAVMVCAGLAGSAADDPTSEAQPTAIAPSMKAFLSTLVLLVESLINVCIASRDNAGQGKKATPFAQFA
jgi:hypothetical protein